MTEDKQKKSPKPCIKGYSANQAARTRNEDSRNITEGYNARVQVQTRNEPITQQPEKKQRQGESSKK